MYGINWQYSTLFYEKNMNGFWNCIKRSRKPKNIKANVTHNDFANHFEGIMKMTGDLTEGQKVVENKVEQWYLDGIEYSNTEVFTPENIDKFIKALNKGCSPGIDGVTSEHLQYGNSEILRSCLSSVYNCMLNYSCVPNIFTCGIIVPILKKSSLNANLPCNYRPITLSSIHTKLVEMIMLPDYEADDSQYGFRAKRGTSFGCTLLNDIMCYF